MIVWLASYPRSGNTLYRLALFHLAGIRSSSVYGDPFFEGAGLAGVVGHRPLPMPLFLMDWLEHRYFVKTHKGPTDNNRAVVVVRDGRDVLVSLARYSGGDFRATLAAIMRGQDGHASWSEYVFKWLNRTHHPGPTALVRYEDLVADPAGQLRRSVGELGLDVEIKDEGLPSFEMLHDRNPHFFRRGQAGTWRDEFPEDMQTEFWATHGAAMEALGYAR